MTAKQVQRLRECLGYSRKELGILLGADENNAERIISEMEDELYPHHIHALKNFNFGVWCILNEVPGYKEILNDICVE